jgi:DNA-binding NarL/FixJ family response regulator
MNLRTSPAPDSLLQAQEQAHDDALDTSTAGPSRTLIVEPDTRIRVALATALQGAVDFTLIAHGATWPEVTSKSKGERIDLALVTLMLDGRTQSTLALIRELRLKQPNMRVMVIGHSGDEQNIVLAIEAGAVGYVLSDAATTEQLATMRHVRAGGSPMSPQIARVLLDRMVRLSDTSAALGAVAAAASAVRFGRRKQDVPPTVPIKLSDREREVLGYLSKGFHYHEIAALLRVSPQTVPTYIKRLYHKLSVHSRGEAVFEAGRMGLLSAQ